MLSQVDEMEVKHSSLFEIFIAGGLIGSVIDIIFFPIDTIKTRLQSPNGFSKAGGFRNIYKGVGSIGVVAFPHHAFFFYFYHLTKRTCEDHVSSFTLRHTLAVIAGELTGNAIRVPGEVVKQRAQVSGRSSFSCFASTIKQQGFRGLFRGYVETNARDIPYSIIQFTIWEGIKHRWSMNKGRPATPFESSIAGTIGAVISSFVTTPFDVAKTRVILAERNSDLLASSSMRVIYQIGSSDGFTTLFKGGVSRVSYFAVAGSVFFYMYEECLVFLNRLQIG